MNENNLGHAKKQSVARACWNSKNPDQPYNLIKTFVIHRYSLQYTMILWAGSEGPDQTAHKRSLIRTFAVRWSGPSLSVYARRHVFALRGQNFECSPLPIQIQTYIRDKYINLYHSLDQFSRRQVNNILSIFSQKIGFDISSKLSP